MDIFQNCTRIIVLFSFNFLGEVGGQGESPHNPRFPHLGYKVAFIRQLPISPLFLKFPESVPKSDLLGRKFKATVEAVYLQRIK